MTKEIHVSEHFKMIESSGIAISSLFPRLRMSFYDIVDKWDEICIPL